MKFTNAIIGEIQGKDLMKEPIIIENCIIYETNFVAHDFHHPVEIRNSIIDEFSIHSCWFRNGLQLKNNQIMKYVNYQMGGHNSAEFSIQGNIFNEFFNFFDCHFEGDVSIEDNVFIKGTNLLGNLTEGFRNLFGTPPKIKNNIGMVDMDGEGI